MRYHETTAVLHVKDAPRDPALYLRLSAKNGTLDSTWSRISFRAAVETSVIAKKERHRIAHGALHLMLMCCRCDGKSKAQKLPPCAPPNHETESRDQKNVLDKIRMSMTLFVEIISFQNVECFSQLERVSRVVIVGRFE